MRCRVCSVTELFSGSSSRSSCARLVSIRRAIAALASFRAYISCSICHASTLLMACSVASSRMPSSARSSSSVEPAPPLLDLRHCSSPFIALSAASPHCSWYSCRIPSPRSRKAGRRTSLPPRPASRQASGAHPCRRSPRHPHGLWSRYVCHVGAAPALSTACGLAAMWNSESLTSPYRRVSGWDRGVNDSSSTWRMYFW